MDVLAREGQAKLRVDTLAGELGVTKGSFYHHFANRADFVHSLLDYWSSAYTARVIAEIGALNMPAADRLLHLMQLVEREGLDRYDIAFRSWAAQDAAVAEAVRAVDLARYRFIRSLFAEMGFAGRALEDRVRVWLVYQSAKCTVFVPTNEDDSAETVARLHRFFVRPQADS